MSSMTNIKMKPIHILTCFVVSLIGLSCCMGAPTTRPLEHSPSELAWDAWLKQGHPPDVIPARRITTKSLFIFPNLGADSLPACAEGYRPDAMGRCVKVVKVNESAHLEFLLQKLNSQFATDSGSGSDEVYDYDIETEPSDGSGPFQINIPLALPHSGHKSDENQQGEYVYVSKKDPPPSEYKPSTSSPEIVPDFFDSHSTFFLGKPPAKPQNTLSQDNSPSTEDVALFLQNSTGVGLTLMVPANEKIKNTSENNKMDKVKVSTILTGGEVDKEIIKSEDILTTTLKTVDETKQSHGDEETNRRKNPSSGNKETTSHKAESENNQKIDEFVEQIEALKRKAEAIKENLQQQQQYMETSSVDQPGTMDYNQKGVDKINPENIDIEEKIKIISQFADVSRNTQDFKDLEKPYKSENSYVRFPQEHVVDYSYDKTIDLLPVPNSPIQIPVNSHGMPIPQNSVYNVHPPNSYEKLQPLHFDNAMNEGNYKPQWLPYGWNVHGNSNGEQNLIDFWSRLSMAQRYPYNVRMQQEHRPTYYPSLYPSSRETSGKLINARHTAVNYRQGRDQMPRRRGLYEDDPINHKRSQHPHFRNPNGYSPTLQAYNGR